MVLCVPLYSRYYYARMYYENVFIKLQRIFSVHDKFKNTVQPNTILPFLATYQLIKNTKEVLDMFFWNYYTLCIIRAKLESRQWIFDSIHKILSKQKRTLERFRSSGARARRTPDKRQASPLLYSLFPSSLRLFPSSSLEYGWISWRRERIGNSWRKGEKRVEGETEKREVPRNSCSTRMKRNGRREMVEVNERIGEQGKGERSGSSPRTIRNIFRENFSLAKPRGLVMFGCKISLHIRSLNFLIQIYLIFSMIISKILSFLLYLNVF